MVDRVAPTLANVLIQGESGTGKELIARRLHERSTRAHRPFLALNCATLKDSLLESELFGHEKGAFTGAIQKKIGMAEAANGGTLFLDEIGELSLSVQTKLLRFLQEGEFYRVGGKDVIKVDVRVICATNRDLEQEVQKGNFREDLYYRVNTILLETTPLRRRKEDIPVLIQHFMQKGRVNLGRPILKFSDAALKALLSYDWPGNIRELENLCERLQVLAETDVVELSDLPDQIVQRKQTDPTRDYDPTVKISDLERTWILKAMEHFRGNKTQAAVALGITIKTLYNKLHEYGAFEKYALHSKVEND
jgi:two-component system response regulator HydG